MAQKKVLCAICSTEIIPHYDRNYKGKRAHCPKCEVDFPLD